uniref:Uncharacterized protein n=1 Tax=Hyaloperonospora arabidopsidis (strain Emoy2) TaxID=559515 RepID=M4BVH0_HYAAE
MRRWVVRTLVQMTISRMRVRCLACQAGDPCRRHCTVPASPCSSKPLMRLLDAKPSQKYGFCPGTVSWLEDSHTSGSFDAIDTFCETGRSVSFQTWNG